MTTLRR